MNNLDDFILYNILNYLKNNDIFNFILTNKYNYSLFNKYTFNTNLYINNLSKIKYIDNFSNITINFQFIKKYTHINHNFNHVIKIKLEDYIEYFLFDQKLLHIFHINKFTNIQHIILSNIKINDILDLTSLTKLKKIFISSSSFNLLILNNNIDYLSIYSSITEIKLNTYIHNIYIYDSTILFHNITKTFINTFIINNTKIFVSNNNYIYINNLIIILCLNNLLSYLYKININVINIQNILLKIKIEDKKMSLNDLIIFENIINNFNIIYNNIHNKKIKISY